MPSIVIVGAQWGDEGKGKFVDVLTERADWVVRFQGGSNAGHTIVKPCPGPCSASSSASVTGPMLPAGVESKVEQYLK